MSLQALFASHCKYAAYSKNGIPGAMAIEVLPCGGTGIVH
jgi:hypothetical protein